MGFFDFFKKNNEIDNAKNYTKEAEVLSQDVTFDEETSSKLKNIFIALDTETTGLSPKNDRIVEFSAIVFEHGKITNSISTLINPEMKMPLDAQKINNITDEMLVEAPKEREVLSKISGFLNEALRGNILMCAHNAKFDIGFLCSMLKRNGFDANIKYVDPLLLARNLISDLSNYKQNTVAAYFNIENTNSHRAENDAVVCGQIMWKLLQESELPTRTLSIKHDNKTEEDICNYFIEKLSSKKDASLFKIEHRSKDYTSLFYGNNNFMRVKYTPLSKWISFSMFGEIAKENMDNPLFDAQKNKNQFQWKSKFNSFDELSRYIEFAENGCYVLKVAGDEPLSEAEQPVADYLKNMLVALGADPKYIKYRHLSDHAEVVYLGKAIDFKMYKKKSNYIKVDKKIATKQRIPFIPIPNLPYYGKYEFTSLEELDGLQKYIEAEFKEMEKNKESFLRYAEL